MRLFGITIPDQKRIDVSLTYFYGIGKTTSEAILKAIHIDPAKRTKDLDPEETNKIKDYIEKTLKIEGELRQVVRANISRLKDIQSYRGSRHARKLPVRGQRTKTNSRTVRGNTRKTAGSGKRKVDLK
ncbi:MAG: 30S ribosomal protein S13 [Candidatus Paceibacterota bacterium]